MQPNGGMGLRLQLPIGSKATSHRPAADGQFGTVLRVYWEFKVSGDIAWLKKIWPNVKRSIYFVWSEENPDAWDRDKDGILEGRQHQTLDMELFGPNSWLSVMYLAALKAATELAGVMNVKAAAEDFKEVYEKGV